LTLDPGELEAAFNERTKMIIICTPNNPTGKVYITLNINLID
jgi:aspartate/methionine/tyrosine aminotransferase